MKRVYINGEIYTVTDGWAEAFVVEDDKFIFVGNKNEAIRTAGEDVEIIDLKGAFVTAGFNDSHMHVLNYGYSLTMVNLSKNTKSLKEVLKALETHLEGRKLEKNQWILGRGWNQDYFQDEKRFPNRYDLDKVSTDYPICITRACGHVTVVNSKALQLMGVTKDTEQVYGGRFDTDEKGEPLGIFRENALSMVYEKVPAPSKEQIKEMLLEAFKSLNSYGVTSAQSDDFQALAGVEYETVIKAYKELEEEKRLSVKIYEQTLFSNKGELKEYIDKGYNTGQGTEYFKLGPLKLLGDGSLGARTAFLNEPYSDDENTKGIATFSKEEMEEIISYAHNNSMQIAVHCIGDGMMTIVMEAFEKALINNPKKDHRHGIVHCQIANEELLNKFKELELHAYIQSIFLDYDINIVEARVGEKRAKTSYNFKTLMDTVVTSNGSDCPVELPDVLKGIQCAVTRCTLDGKVGPYLKEQALSVEEALKSYTILGAHSSFEEEIKGAIAVNKKADFVVLDKNIFKVYEGDINKIRVLETYVNGNCVYKA